MKEIKYNPLKNWSFWVITALAFFIESFRFISTNSQVFQAGQVIGTFIGSAVWGVGLYTVIYFIKKGLAARKR